MHQSKVQQNKGNNFKNKQTKITIFDDYVEAAIKIQRRIEMK
jgi:hypothetical protein